MKNIAIASLAFVASMSAASAAEFYVVQNTGNKSCMIVDQKPTTSTTMVVGDGKGYITRNEAEAALKADSTCVAMNNTDTAMRRVLAKVPAGASTIKNFYNQTVYDGAGTKVGEIDDVLLGTDARVEAFVVGVGGFLGVGEKYVLVPFTTIRSTMKDNKNLLTITATKEELKDAPGVKLDNTKMTWVQS